MRARGVAAPCYGGGSTGPGARDRKHGIVGALGFSATHTPIQGWTTFEGRLPYLAVAFLAGYSSQVFMLKLKEIADATFSPQDPKERALMEAAREAAREKHPSPAP